jgi:hypothetical protein
MAVHLHGILQVVYSSDADETRQDRAWDASVARLAESMRTPEPKIEVTSLTELERATGKAPWEMTGPEFAASAALRLVGVWGLEADRLKRASQPPERAMGLKRSYLREGTELRLDVEWAPPGGYVVLIPQEEESTLGDPRRAFVKLAMDKGIVIAPEILAAFPELNASAENEQAKPDGDPG